MNANSQPYPPNQALYSNPAETSILGEILLSNGASFAGVAAELQPEDFFLGSHRVIFRAMSTLDAAGSSIDLVTLCQKLVDSKEIANVGGYSYISSLTNGLPKLSNITHYVEIVKHKRDYRRILAAANKAGGSAVEQEVTPEELAAQVAQQMGEIVTASKRGGFVSFSDALKQSYDSVEQIGARRNGTGMPTGLRSLDDLLGGLRKSEMIVIAGRPSLGKTALAVTIGMNAAKHDSKVALFSLEMAREAIVQRMLCAEARVNSFKVMQGCASREDKAALIAASVRLGRLNFWIDDEIQRVETMMARAKALQQQNGLDLLIIDYLQFILGGKHESRVQEISYISRSVKQMAKMLDIPVIAVAQLNRAPEERGGAPKLSDLRDSGQIEQDSDVVAFLWRDQAAKKHASREQEFEQPDNTVNLSIEKQRNGPIGQVKLAFLAEYCRFEDRN